jgi:RNA polymerase subunit RPABC4/transcription elongation factor Spt4
MSRVCSRCKAENSDQARICRQCKAPLEPGTPGRLCPAGLHVMDPGWQVCPYCASQKSHRGETTHQSGRGEPTAGDNKVATPPGSYPGDEKKVETIFGDVRRIVGVLITYTWRPEGELFLVREGRNLLGSAPECDIRVTTDPRLSARHAYILHRPGSFLIYDEKSMSGTFVNGESVEEKPHLPDSADLRTGGTIWRFAALEPPQKS